MAKLKWSIMCRRAIIDKKDNLLSIIDVIESVEFSSDVQVEEAKEWTTIPYDVTLVCLMERSDLSVAEEFKTRVRVMADNDEIFENGHEFSVNLKDNKTNRIILGMKNLPFLYSGRYNFVIEAFNDEKWEGMGGTSIEVSQRAE